MATFNDLHVEEFIYIIDDDPISILELKLIEIGFDENHRKRIKVTNSDLTFDLDFEDIEGRVFKDKDYAQSVATKLVFDETNKYIRKITGGHFNDYFDLDDSLEHFKKEFPEIFI